jgi:DNA-binding NarL/FixJ family response regulator
VAGQAVLDPAVQARLLSAVTGRPASGPATGVGAPAAHAALESLTAREREVLTLIAQGLSNREIARQLFIGEATVKTHLLRAFEKLQVTDRTAAVTAAYRLGLLDLSG